MTRLEVEPVSRLVLVDRQRSLVYALDPRLVALDLTTGKERWRVQGVTGDSLWRVGQQLAVSTEGAKLPPTISFVDPHQPTKPVDCTLALAAPKEADHANLHLFDRAGQAYAYWVSRWTYSGGVPPDGRARARERSSLACGVVKIDSRSCSLEAVKLSDFLWDPPEGRPAEECALSPLRDLPAAAASAPRLRSAPAVLALGAYETALRVTTIRQTSADQCTEITKLTLEAHNPAGELLWTHPLEDRQQYVCKAGAAE